MPGRGFVDTGWRIGWGAVLARQRTGGDYPRSGAERAKPSVARMKPRMGEQVAPIGMYAGRVTWESLVSLDHWRNLRGGRRGVISEGCNLCLRE